MSGTSEGAFLVRSAHAILTGEAGEAARSSATDIRVAGGGITEMGRDLQARPGERVLDASDCVIYPGWVNTHHHLFQSLLKGVPSAINATLTPWLKAVPYAHRGGFDEDTMRLAARVGLVELLLSGSTTVGDHHYIYYPGMGFDPSAALFEEAARLGQRFMLLRGGATQTRDAEAGAPAHLRPESLDQMVGGVERDVGRWHQRGPRAMSRVAMAPTTVTISIRTEEAREIARAARRLGVPMHSHLSETVSYMEHCGSAFGCLPVEYAERVEWLGPDVWFAHLVHLSESERALLAQTGTGMAHCPQSNGRLGSGVAPAPDLARRGVPVSIGVDGAASNEAADMLSEVHQCWLLHRAHAGAASRPREGGGGEAGADAVTVEDIVHWGTAGGARVMGFEGVGTLAVGQAADFAVYDLDDPRYMGLHDLALGPVVSGGRPRLRWLMGAGRVLVEDDTVPGLDLHELRVQARAAVKRLAEKAVRP
ncbi:amidohydrolase family protein [Ramlibacter rhizophilus]|uniref:Amidohydrolase n=1 Tax=Ramlibacter rhizophilus TaxID=1781167 RepID=A0A4Z0BPS4_9BURK|nr:amidohydrolase family protein [Ramlibacter rhizophilus]TFZ01293.1 amidohydrolase [Ramlibacter rhizophilus]